MLLKKVFVLLIEMLAVGVWIFPAFMHRDFYVGWYNADSFAMQSLLTWCRILPLNWRISKRKNIESKVYFR